MISDNGTINNLGAASGRQPETTGNSIVVLDTQGKRSSYARTLRNVAGVSSIASSSDFDGQAVNGEQTQGADATVFTELGVAVLQADPDQHAALAAAAADEGGAVLSIEPEYINYVLTTAISAQYARGYRDGVADFSERIAADGQSEAFAAVPATFADTDQFTWGLLATGVNNSALTGRGVRVAVLDTGFDLNHPDFAGRSVASQSFVAGQAVQDGHGHGTHCIGTSCGPKKPDPSRRYGVAYEADIFAGKVLSNQGSGPDGAILAGINWAVANRCQVISMSLGAPVPTVSSAYETAGRRALDAGSLIVAAAGNDSRRPGSVAPVGRPANSPSILAVAALDSALAIGFFSNQSNPVDGGQIDIAGPGVNVYSSWPMPKRYNTISGTSMATPHVAGIAALLCQESGRTGRDLWAALAQAARRLPIPSVDVGAGLVQASAQQRR